MRKRHQGGSTWGSFRENWRVHRPSKAEKDRGGGGSSQSFSFNNGKPGHDPSPRRAKGPTYTSMGQRPMFGLRQNH